MGGWTERTRGAAGTHDPLYATVLLLDSGSTSLALVACDLDSFVSTRVASTAKSKYGVGYTILSMSGTHSGASTADPRSKWHAATEDKIVDAIGEARQGLFPAEIGVPPPGAPTWHSIGARSGGTRAHGGGGIRTGAVASAGPDGNIMVVRDAGKIRAVVVNYAARATVLGPRTWNSPRIIPALCGATWKRRRRARCACSCRARRATSVRTASASRGTARGLRQSIRWAANWPRRCCDWSRSRSRCPGGAAFTDSPSVVEIANRWQPQERLRSGSRRA